MTLTLQNRIPNDTISQGAIMGQSAINNIKFEVINGPRLAVHNTNNNEHISPSFRVWIHSHIKEIIRNLSNSYIYPYGLMTIEPKFRVITTNFVNRKS